MLRVCVDGGISAGKSTVIRSLVERHGVAHRLEPVQSWAALLADMYVAPQRWAMTLNARVLLSFNQHAAKDEAEKPPVVVYERSPLSCRHVFAELQRDLGHMTGEEMAVLDDLFTQTCFVPDVLVYLRTTPDVAYARMQKRARSCESAVDAAYLRHVCERYDAFVADAQQRYPAMQVIIVDADRSGDEVLKDVDAALERVRQSQLYP